MSRNLLVVFGVVIIIGVRSPPLNQAPNTYRWTRCRSRRNNPVAVWLALWRCSTKKNFIPRGYAGPLALAWLRVSSGSRGWISG